KEFNGRIYRIHPTVNPLSRTFEAEIEVPNNNELLRPGMFVRVSIDMGEIESLVVPSSAVLIQEGTNERFVFVAEGTTASRRVVKLGKRFDDMVEIAGGEISAGDNLIVDGQARLLDGRSVEIVK
ncbi:MAG: efflux RND transporter periplasmic adaptor subunit, partial [Bacteroidales bacterium]|nr:efflux RND transporter periplasmic adaptor subunit [Bacteroidales bacterium]